MMSQTAYEISLRCFSISFSLTNKNIIPCKFHVHDVALNLR